MNDVTVHSKPSQSLAAARENTTPQAVQAKPSAPSHDEIARRAYDIFVKGGCQPGQCHQNWFQAERELKSKEEAPAAAAAGA